MNVKKSCASCAFCIEDEYGYSEWTITGAIYNCMGAMNPSFPLDDADDKKGVLEYADTCPAFREGIRLLKGMRVDDEKKEFADWTSQFAANGEAK